MKKHLWAATFATAVIVAAAPIAQAATFTDIASYDEATQKEITSLHELGIINGTTATTFSPARDITRAQVVKILGRYLVKEGYATVPADALTKERYSDIKVTGSDKELIQLAAVVKDYGIFNGSNGQLKPRDVMNRQNMVLVLSRLVDAVEKDTNVLVTMAKGKPTNVTDLAKAKAETKDIIQAFNALGLSNAATFNPNNNVKRSHFASFMYRIIELLDEEEVEETPIAPIPGTYTASDLGLQSITRIVDATSEIGPKLTNGMLQVVQSTNQNPGDFFEIVDVEGKTLFGHPRTTAAYFFAHTNGVVYLDQISGTTVRVPLAAFKIDTFKSVTYKTQTGATDEEAAIHSNGVLALTDSIGVNNIVTLTLRGTYEGQDVTRTVQYYFNGLGEVIFNTPNSNMALNYHYEMADTGDILVDGALVSDKKLYYFPINETLGWDAVSFGDDWTLAQLQKLFGTDGTKAAIDFKKHNAMLIVDDELTNYGVKSIEFMDGFFTSYTQNVKLPFSVNIQSIEVMGNVVAKRVSNDTLALTVIGPEPEDALLFIEAASGREYILAVRETGGKLSVEEVGDDW
ncbi:MAG: S-layer homology domain-containing protein [Caryophanon sp.]|nr:S-layer homology domain-containing protein [Caryophanon sp.]